jgi:transcriptional regulator with XRE-family HTH domain
MDAADHFAGRLRELREAAGLTQQQLGERAGLSWNSVARLERAEREPSWRSAVTLAAALGVPVGAFLESPARRGAVGPGRPARAEADGPPARSGKGRPAAKKTRRPRGTPKK